MDYCWNCKHWSSLPDGTYCSFCLSFFNNNRRMPLATDVVPATDSLSAIKQAMGWS